MSGRAPPSGNNLPPSNSTGGAGGGGGGGRKRPSDDISHSEVNKEEEEDEDLLHVDDLFGDHDALYGSSTDTECTYSRGYLPRQPVYACRTCKTDGPAVICYGCAKRCHEDHDLIELYSKRGLCCDCGNAKFTDVVDQATGEKFACQLCEFKTLNRDNKYNQNFNGLYCVCARPYPDPENPASEEMLQCAICEDWYHSDHLAMPAWCHPPGGQTLPPESYEELVCQLCSARLPYLGHYALTEAPVTESSDKPAGMSDTPSDACLLHGRAPAVPACDTTVALLMPAGWRRRLCRCPDCQAAYARDGIACLTDPADSLVEFELANRREAEEQSRPENVLRSLANAGVPHVSVQLVASAIGDFRRGLSHAMASVLAEKNCPEGQPAVITREDADRILAMMAPLLAKRARFQPPDTCRKD